MENRVINHFVDCRYYKESNGLIKSSICLNTLIYNKNQIGICTKKENCPMFKDIKEIK